MTIDKAIEILDNHQADMSLTPAIDLREALKLGIEALKRERGDSQGGEGPVNTVGQCPECGSLLVHQEGCAICPACGYSRC